MSVIDITANEQRVTHIKFSPVETDKRGSQISIERCGRDSHIELLDYRGVKDYRVRLEDVPKLIEALQRVLEETQYELVRGS